MRYFAKCFSVAGLFAVSVAGACVAVESPASAAGTKDFIGWWKNADQSNRRVSYLNIGNSRTGRLLVRMGGDCRAPICRWGTVTASTLTERRWADARTDAKALLAKFEDNSGAARTVLITAARGGRLVVQVMSVRTDGNTYRRYVFARAVQAPRPAPLLQPSCVSFSPDALGMFNRANRWTVVHARQVLVTAGRDPRSAWRAMNFIRRNGFTQKCVLPGTSFEFWRTGSGLPKGVSPREDCVSIDTRAANVRQVGNRFIVGAGERSYMAFDSRLKARSALAQLRTLNVAHACYLGRPNPYLTYLKTD